MSQLTKDIPWVNSALFTENINKIPHEVFLKYAGQWVAWNLEGTQVLAHGAEWSDVENRLQELGLDPARVVFDHVPLPDTSVGGGFIEE